MSLRTFWHAHRTSTRLAFVLQTFTRLANAGLNLWWTRLLVFSMGDTLWGLFSWFQAIATLGGLGDLGLGGIIALRLGRHMGERQEDTAEQFLASARSVFAMLALTMLLAGVVLAPWLPGWFGLDRSVAGAGSFPLLFVMGAISAALLVSGSYINSVNYALQNITWPVLPGFLLVQLSFAAHWLLAVSGAPLTLQYVPYLVSSAMSLLLAWWFIRVSHPRLAALFPITFRWREWRHLAGQSVWSYLWGLGNVVFTNIATLFIGPIFGTDLLTRYRINGKLPDLAFFVIVTAGSVVLPKLTMRLAASDPAEKARAYVGITRLNQLQAFLGCSAGVTYLLINDWFVAVWMTPQHRIPLEWQWAFAMSLAITGCAAAMIQIATRCGDNGLRSSGALVGIAAGLNFLLAFLTAKLGSVFGVACSTLIAQAFLAFVLGRFVCRYLKIPFGRWLLGSFVLPVALVSAAYLLRVWLPPTAAGISVVAVGGLVLIACAAWFTGWNTAMLRAELEILSGFFKRKKNTLPSSIK